MLQLKEHELRSLLKDFYTLTHIRIVVFDSEMREVLSYPEEHFAFCAILRKNEVMNRKCAAGDLQACRKCAKTQGAVTYRCHAGLTETVVPIQDELGVIGYLMFGQVLPGKGAEKVKTAILQELPEREFPGITHAMGQIPIISEEQIAAAATILQALTAYVHTSHMVMPLKANFLRQLDDYIAANLSGTVTAEELCRELGINRTRLYALARRYLGMGVAEYIRNARIIAAKKLLTATDMPVTEIADATGFADYTHFSRVFRASEGISAREYRKGIRG